MPPLGDRPTSSRLSLHLPISPVSQQAQAGRKAAFVARIREITATAGYLISGDVAIEIEWRVPEIVRYETDRSPDVDNILKPLLDALTGPEGLLIDDNQVQHVSCTWVDSNDDSEEIQINISFLEDDWVSKQDLVFVQFDRGLCLPLPHLEPTAARLTLFEALKELLSARFKSDSAGLPYPWSRSLMPQQRVFHRSRLGGFKVLDEEATREMLGASNKKPDTSS